MRRWLSVGLGTVLALLAIVVFATPRPAAVVGEPSARLRDEKEAEIRAQLLAILSEEGIHAAMAQLKAASEADEAVLRSCHALSHEIGRAAYEQVHDFARAASAAEPWCNSGYLHGVIEEHFSGTSDVFATLQTTCEGDDPASFMGWECYHGVGHGLMYFTGNDIPASLAWCDGLLDESARGYCVNGVYMENFAADNLMHPTLWQRPSDPFYPCEEQAEDRKASCYLYTPTYYLRLHPDAYQEALAWCATAASPYASVCARGVGSETLQQNYERVAFVESVCATAPDDLEESCIRGMVGLSVSYTGTIEAAEELCERLSASHQTICESEVELKRQQFSDFH